MVFKALLLGSVSAAAVSAGIPAAQAADFLTPPLPDVEALAGFSFSVEGGFLMGPNAVGQSWAESEDKLGGDGVVTVPHNVGYRAAISLGKQLDPFWDLRAGGSINHQLTATSTREFTESGPGFFFSHFTQLKTDFDFENLDFEVGYRPNLDGNVDLRLFGGLRGLHYKDTVDKLGVETFDDGFNFGTASLSTNMMSEFIGAGPRIGASASTRFGDSNFGISGMVAGAAIFGVQRTNTDGAFTFASSGGGGGTFVLEPESTEEWKTVIDVEAALGLDYHVTEQATLTVGYRAQQLFGVGGTEISTPFDSWETAPDRLVHGPFLKFAAEF